MRRHETDQRATTSATESPKLRPEFVVVLLFILIWLPASAEQPDTAPPATYTALTQGPLTAEQVVKNLGQMNRDRARALQSYQGTRIYRVEYRGFPSNRSAAMVVNVKYVSPGTKEFTVKSETGSQLIIDRVLKRLLDAEREALDAEAQEHSALTEENYRFTLSAYESGLSGATYVLRVEPRTKDKFLYRGRVWVDATDFAVVRLEAEPARNPSFWTRKTEIVQEYAKVNGFWLPAHNRSVTNIRIGGHAELTIDYTDYEITGDGRADSISALRPAEREKAAGAQE